MMLMMHVLVVDDDAPTREVLRMMLEEHQYHVAEVGDGAQALQALRASRSPLVVLLDLDLPRVDGLAVIQAVVAEPRLARRHRLIVMTAVSEARRESTRALREALNAALIPKPFDVDDLLAVVDHAAGRILPAF